MTRRALLGLFFVMLSAFVQTHHSRALPPGDDVVQFRRNQPLLEALVANSVRIVQADAEPLLRAAACIEIARQFADEVEQAVRNHDLARAAELGKHLHSLLERGVGENLKAARRLIPQGSTEEANLRKVSERALDLLQAFHSSLQLAAASEEQGEVRATLEELLHKQAALEQGLRSVATVANH